MTPLPVATIATDKTTTIGNFDNLMREQARYEALKSGMKLMSETRTLKEQALSDGRMGDHHRYAMELEFLVHEMKYLKGQITVEEWDEYVQSHQ